MMLNVSFKTSGGQSLIHLLYTSYDLGTFTYEGVRIIQKNDLLPGPSTKPNISPNVVHALAQTAMECKRKKAGVAAAVLVPGRSYEICRCELLKLERLRLQDD